MLRQVLRRVRERYPRVPGGESIREILKHPVPLPPDLGSPVEDAVRLADSPVLAHLAVAGGAGRAQDLLSGVTYRQAPDPSAWLASRFAAHAALPPMVGAPLKILSFNVALLHRTYLGQTVESPHRAVRRGPLVEAIFGGGYDVILLQEVWNDDDAAAFRAASSGYSVVTGSRRHNHGLLMAIREDLVVREERGEHIYRTQYHLEGAPGPSIRRGFLRWTIDTPHLGRLTFFDTHTSAFPWASTRRSLQARELGIAARARPSDEVVIVGGDLNAGLYYRDDVRRNPHGKDTPGWWANATSIPLLLHYGGLEDLVHLGGPAQDVAAGNALPDGLVGLEDLPPGETFTASDSNSLYAQQYGGTEIPARIDHLLVRQADTVRVRSSAVVFQERLPIGPTAMELSDHYGVTATIELPRRHTG